MAEQARQSPFRRFAQAWSGVPLFWRLAVYALAGALVGLGVFTVRVSRAMSYLSDDPRTCLNCHVMTNAYATWERGSHGKVAVCNDCHVPHSNVVAKMAFKAQDGMRHSYVFTLHREPQVLRPNPGAIPVIQSNCIRCHSNQFMMIRLAGSAERKCWDCHTNVHGKVQSLSASPNVRRPQLPSAGLDWMKK